MSGFHWTAKAPRGGKGDLLLQRFTSILHEQADGCGCCVELGDFILFNDLPEAADVRVDGNTFKLGKKTETRLLKQNKRTELAHAPIGDPPPTTKAWEEETDQDTCGSVCQWAVGDVRVARDPADVSCAPVHVTGVVVEHTLEGERRVEQVPGHSVEDTLCQTRGRKCERGMNWSKHRQQRCFQRAGVHRCLISSLPLRPTCKHYTPFFLNHDI